MSGKIVEINCIEKYKDTVLSNIKENQAVVISSQFSDTDMEHVSIRIFIENENVQATIDSIQKLLPTESEPLILITSVDAQIGGKNEQLLKTDIDNTVATREELFSTISKGTECDFNFILLAILATVVATIGIAEDNVAIVIAAMVIAPLLGPNLGLALGAALGDKGLIKKGFFTNAIGVAITILLSVLLALIWPPNMESNELISRTKVSPEMVILALAAGIAAVQSLVSRASSLLVGVMVAVALVPPATVLGMMIGIENWSLAAQAGLLLTINVASINCAAQIVFLLHGVRPRTWLAQRSAKQSTWLSIIFWVVMLSSSISIALLLQ